MTIADRVEDVRARIADAAARAGRDASEVTLVAVTKTVDVERMREAVAAGIADLGENRAQELEAKIRDVSGARWHFIGTLQRNKVRAIAGRVALIHSVDSVPLADAIARAAGSAQDVLIEVNTSGERSKHGVHPDVVDELVDAVARDPRLDLKGFMTIAQAGDERAVRASFTRLREVRDRVAADHPAARDLSMGMSGDFELAVEEGATIVRVGTAIFGERPRLGRHRR
ncbi:MAG: YggS family pyridoxal phosphate-dependent enzyme [Actinomycetota bacterium]